MRSTADLIRTARTQRGLSQRALANRAGVEQSTIARIENGDTDPTWTTVGRLLEAAGFTLDDPTPTIPTLAEAALGDDELDWTMIRAVTDRAAQQQDEVQLLIGAEPPAYASRIARTILASIAAFLADENQVRSPRWVRETRPLDTPWHLPGTPRMIQIARLATPPVVARYNVWLRPDVLKRRSA
jgi:transcriptional regulator with XRE-family HTH domain